jgi:response regulator NasT
LLVADHAGRAALLQRALDESGYAVIAQLSDTVELAAQVMQLKPDVIVIASAAPDCAALANVALLNRDDPHPVVMFSAEGDTGAIERAVRAGIGAYVVNGLDPARIKNIVDVAVVRFREEQALRRELAQTRAQLANRRQIDRAKSLLMRHHNLDEERAYKLMRKMAMDRGQRLAEIAAHLIAVLEFLETRE